MVSMETIDSNTVLPIFWTSLNLRFEDEKEISIQLKSMEATLIRSMLIDGILIRVV